MTQRKKGRKTVRFIKNPVVWTVFYRPYGGSELYIERRSKSHALKTAKYLKKTGAYASVRVGKKLIRPLVNPQTERKKFFEHFQSDPFYKALARKGAARLLRDLKKGTFDRKFWIETLEAIAVRVAKERGIKLNRFDRLKIAYKIGRSLWEKYVRQGNTL